DVIYIDPSQIDYPVAINLMELPINVSGSDLAVAKDFIAEAIVSIFRKIFSDDDSGGHRIEYILRNVIYTAFNVPNATLMTLHKLLTNDLYRAGVVASLRDEALKEFWIGEYNKAGSYQRVKMISGVTAKLGRFARSVSIANIISQSRSTINFDKLLDQRKILICNFAKGSIGEDNSTLLGMLILAKLQLAAVRRSLIPSAKRIPFYLYVDEFELFNAPIFSQLISEARKFGMFLTLAEQTTVYQEDRDSNILLANVGNLVCFRTGSEIDSRRILPAFRPYLSTLDLTNIEPYKFYLKTAGSKTRRPLSAQTITLKGNAKEDIFKRVIKLNQLRYTRQFTADNSVSNRDYRVPVARS
ncbi:MAG: type IV secretory system conjugative DNA transfer family protein, partial [Candidatus Saccharimonadales bacterium]